MISILNYCIEKSESKTNKLRLIRIQEIYQGFVGGF